MNEQERGFRILKVTQRGSDPDVYTKESFRIFRGSDPDVHTKEIFRIFRGSDRDVYTKESFRIFRISSALIPILPTDNACGGIIMKT